MAYVGWNDSTGGLTGWPPAWQEAYRSERPPFDPEFSETDRQMGRVPERIRTWPGARVSGSHFRRMAAIGWLRKVRMRTEQDEAVFHKLERVSDSVGPPRATAAVGGPAGGCAQISVSSHSSIAPS